MHRSAVRGAMYRRQTESKEWRKTTRYFDAYDTGAAIMQEIEKPYFKEMYRGKPTRRAAFLLRKGQRAIRLIKERELIFSIFGTWYKGSWKPEIAEIADYYKKAEPTGK